MSVEGPDRLDAHSSVRIISRTTRDDGRIESVIGRRHHTVIDCPHPRALAEFYAALLGQPVTLDSPDWVVVSDSDQSSGLAWGPARLELTTRSAVTGCGDHPDLPCRG